MLGFLEQHGMDFFLMSSCIACQSVVFRTESTRKSLLGCGRGAKRSADRRGAHHAGAWLRRQLEVDLFPVYVRDESIDSELFFQEFEHHLRHVFVKVLERLPRELFLCALKASPLDVDKVFVCILGRMFLLFPL